MPDFSRLIRFTRLIRLTPRPGLWAAVLLLGGCAPMLVGPPRVLIHGEQHDQPAHQQQTAETVSALAARGRLAAVVMEMADAGHDTRALAADASEDAARAALGWQERAWPWSAYGPVVMNALRAGVPVLGGNLPRTALRATMADATLDDAVPAAVAELLRRAIDEGHCGLLPAALQPGMLRVQIARDRQMATTVMQALRKATPGQSVLLLTGEQHAARDRGVPLHLVAAGLAADRIRVLGWTGGSALPVDERREAPRAETVDHCADLVRRPPDGAAKVQPPPLR